MNTKDRGDASVAIVLAALVGRGEAVSIPWGDNRPYDLVWERAGVFQRVQVKTGKRYKGGIYFKTHSQRSDHSTVSYKGKADLFAAVFQGLVYIIPVTEVGAVGCLLRVDPLERPDLRTRWAKDFLF